VEELCASQSNETFPFIHLHQLTASKKTKKTQIKNPQPYQKQ